jgi:hypothetical protein
MTEPTLEQKLRAKMLMHKEEPTLEQELQARIFIHQVAIIGGILKQEYIDRETQGSVQLPVYAIKGMADLYSDQIIQNALADGTFEDLYKQSWEKAIINMPEYMSVM